MISDDTKAKLFYETKTIGLIHCLLRCEIQLNRAYSVGSEHICSGIHRCGLTDYDLACDLVYQLALVFIVVGDQKIYQVSLKGVWDQLG